MKFSWRYVAQAIGVVGTIASIVVFWRAPSFPTADKLLVFVTFIFMMFGQGWAVFKRLAPFVALLLVYEQFRGIVPYLNKHVNFTWMVDVDRLLFAGTLPTTTLQNWWWHGSAQWYDFVFYGAYMLHFVLPVAIALLVWKYQEKRYWQYISSFLTCSFSGFLTFLAFPAAPPWMASEKGIIEPIARVSSHVFFKLGLEDFPSVYNKISPNPVAAVPSLHAAYATLVALWVTSLFRPPAKEKRRFSKYSLRWLIWIHPVLIWVGTVYQGEHYAIDEIIGIGYAVGAYFAAPYVLRFVQRAGRAIGRNLAPLLPRKKAI